MVALPRQAQLAIACGGIFFSFSYFAVLQEDVYKKPYNGEYFKYTFLALIAERGINAAIGLTGMMIFGRSGLTIPHRDIFVSGISQMFAMAGSNEALRYVSYPTQVLGKSCKMVPVMAGSIVLGGKAYSATEYVQVLLITLGVCMFNLLGKKKKAGEDSTLGLLLIGFSLIMDAVTGGLQDKVKKRTKELNPDAGEKPVPTMHGALSRVIQVRGALTRCWHTCPHARAPLAVAPLAVAPLALAPQSVSTYACKLVGKLVSM